jgi:putative flippase GtrA
MLAVLVRLWGVHYLIATFVAVETAILHNFCWHIRWTWSDRSVSSEANALLKFNVSTGGVSIVGNLVSMWALVGLIGLNPYFSNLISIALCSLINFLISDRFVFKNQSQPAG